MYAAMCVLGAVALVIIVYLGICPQAPIGSLSAPPKPASPTKPDYHRPRGSAQTASPKTQSSAQTASPRRPRSFAQTAAPKPQSTSQPASPKPDSTARTGPPK
eukprot:695118_1